MYENLLHFMHKLLISVKMWKMIAAENY